MSTEHANRSHSQFLVVSEKEKEIVIAVALNDEENNNNNLIWSYNEVSCKAEEWKEKRDKDMQSIETRGRNILHDAQAHADEQYHILQTFCSAQRTG